MYNDLMDFEAALPDAQIVLEAALSAFKAGDFRTARRLAEQAAALSPQREEPWLLLAALSSAGGARYYLGKVRQVNPQSTRAAAGEQWLDRHAANGQVQRTGALPAGVVLPEHFHTRSAREEPKTQPVKRAQRAPRRASSWLTGIAVIVLVGLGLVFLPAWLPKPSQQEDPRVMSAVETAVKAAQMATSTPTATYTPQPTLTATVTQTASPTSTATVTLTATPKPSETRKPTSIPPTKTPASVSYTVKRGDTLNLIAQRYKVSVAEIIAANQLTNPSMLVPGQVLIIPAAGYVPPAAALPTKVSVPSSNGNGKEIHVDISEQHLYAYENGKLVFSYVVSTGIGNSTRIGTFKVLDKIPNAYSSRFNIWMPYWMGIYYSGTLENGIHGLPLLSNGVELWGNLLGQPATYGCIEARTWEIKKLYEWAEIGTPVIIRR